MDGVKRAGGLRGGDDDAVGGDSKSVCFIVFKRGFGQAEFDAGGRFGCGVAGEDGQFPIRGGGQTGREELGGGEQFFVGEYRGFRGEAEIDSVERLGEAGLGDERKWCGWHGEQRMQETSRRLFEE